MDAEQAEGSLSPLLTFFQVNLADLVQILFWIVVGTLAVLTYRQARRSLFQPLRVEIFKRQLDLLARVNELFAQRSELDLRRHFDLGDVVEHNAQIMAERYAVTALGTKIKEGADYRSRHSSILVGGQISLRHDDQIELVVAPSEAREPTSRDASQKLWSEYDHPLVSLTDKFYRAIGDLEMLTRDPLLPSGLVPLLTGLEGAVRANVDAVRRAITTASGQMPASYPSAPSLATADLGWIANYWNEEAVPLEPHARAISEFVRKYFDSDRAGFHES